MGATDGHAKNFSIFLAPGGRYHLTPLYDVLTASPAWIPAKSSASR
ncbi:HipA domain-containing protein [Bradyrhizobium sp. CIAT3101]|nr:HipA domain-containing protein [Bradyrhizobium sp. CIAT3101]WFU85618.1 HipA domain-containing protein [Bradyrhizobium sp. CIAT3101]